MDIKALESYRLRASLPYGEISYIDTDPHGSQSRVALFVHGVGVNSLLWRKAIQQLKPHTRCVAVDLPIHGYSPGTDKQDYSLPGLAGMLEQLVEELGVDQIDLVGNDSGGAIAQTFAVRRPDLLRSFVLTNCDVHSNLPPECFKETVERAHHNQLWEPGQMLLSNPEAMSKFSEVAKGYEKPELVSIDLYRAFLTPIFGTRESCTLFERMLTSLKAADLIALEPELRKLDVPTKLIWGTEDVFFEIEWAHWLKDRLPHARDITWLPGAKLFFPDERSDEFVNAALGFWQSI